MTIAAGLHANLLHCGRDSEYGAARRTRSRGVGVDLWVNSGLHSGGIVLKQKGRTKQNIKKLRLRGDLFSGLLHAHLFILAFFAAFTAILTFHNHAHARHFILGV